MSNTKDIAENPRKQMGYIKINNKSYAIYEGLNIIGRDLKATVRVTDPKFSKQHAVLSVVNETTHFISDFGSSNGTEVKRNKLIPYKFYKIQDREVIIFGDIIGVYHTSIDATQMELNATQSQIIDPISSTQLLTQNIHDQPTQLFTKDQNQAQKIHTDTTQMIHEANTQQINQSSINVHDLNTQELPECGISATTEEKSQIINIQDDINVSRSELYDDVFANESFRLSLQSNVSKYDIVVDETLPTDNSLMNKNNNVCIDDDEIILSTQDNEMIEKQTLEVIKKSVENKDDSDSETDIEDEEVLLKNLQLKPTKLNDIKLESSKKSAEENKQNDSDSETDAEDDLLSKKNNQEPTNSGSDTELEDNDLVNLPTSSSKSTIESSNINQKPTAIEFSDEEEEIDLLAPTQKLQEVEFLAPNPPLQLKTGTVVEDDDDDDDIPATQLLQSKTNENKLLEVEDDDLLLVPTQLLENEKSQNQSQEDIDLLAQLESKSSDNNKEQVQDETDEDDLAPTQLLGSKCSKNNKEQVHDEADDDDLAPTQLLGSKSSKNNKEQVQDEADDDDLAPTQLLGSKSSKNNKEQVYDEADVEDLAPTQILGSKTNENNKKGVHDEAENEDLAPTQLLERKSDSKEVHDKANDELVEPAIDDDDELPPTQLLKSKRNEKNKNQNDDTFLAPTQILQQNKPDESIFSAPTQILEKNTSSIFSPPKRLSILSTKSPKNKEKRSVNFSEDIIYDLPTQKLENKLNKTDDDIYSAETQPLEKGKLNKSEQDPNESTCSSITGINNLNNTHESVENSFKLVMSETDDSICESTKKQNNSKTNLNFSETTQSKVPVNIPDSETQLEVEFALDTQKEYVEEKTSRPDNPIGHMFAEEQTQMTEEIIETKEASKNESKNKNTADIETSRRLQIQLENIKDITKASTSKTNISSSEENDFKQETTKRGRRKKNIDTVAQNAPKLNITRVKNSEDTKNNNNNDDSLNKSSETDAGNKAHNTRGKRISYQKLNAGKIDKTIPKKPPTRGRAAKSSSSEELLTPKKSQEKLKTPKKEIDINDNSSDMDDFINRVTRSKRTHSAPTPKNKGKQEDNLKIEDSDEDSKDSLPNYSKKKVLKLQFSDDSEIPASNSNSSNSAVVRKTKQSKRSMKIEDYSSDENTNSHAMSICLNTPNTKRRKYEPLNVTVSNSQVPNNSGELLKHKVVFTMLNNTDLENSVKKLGGSIIDSVHLCTVLVTNKITRSLKFLVAVALGKPIVQSKWITDSIKKNSFQDPWNYLLEDTESESKFKFTLKDSLKKSNEKKLLTDVLVLLATKKNAPVLKEIIEASGGKCIQRAPAKNGKAIVVSYEEEKIKYSKYLKQKSLTVVSAEAIFSGILQQELQWDQHLLS